MVDVPIWTKFGSRMQNDTPIMGKWSRSKPEVEFQYGGRLYFETGSSLVDRPIPAPNLFRRRMLEETFLGHSTPKIFCQNIHHKLVHERTLRIFMLCFNLQMRSRGIEFMNRLKMSVCVKFYRNQGVWGEIF